MYKSLKIILHSSAYCSSRLASLARNNPLVKPGGQTFSITATYTPPNSLKQSYRSPVFTSNSNPAIRLPAQLCRLHVCAMPGQSDEVQLPPTFKEKQKSLREQGIAAGSDAGKAKVIIVTGPTAVGKTAVSLQLAKHLGGEIISADSVQVYRHLDIGSDKIPVHERQGIPHHLLDIVDPHEEFSAGAFYKLARQATAVILQRGKVPIVVGGTGFYLRWYIFGPPSTPPSTPELAKQVDEKLQQVFLDAAKDLDGETALTDEARWDAAVAAVASMGDPVSAARLEEVPNNWYRLRRVMEVLIATGGVPLVDQDLRTTAPLDYDFRCYFLHRPRAELYRRIDQRCEEMMLGGIFKESQYLLNEGHRSNTCNATRAIGYRQVLTYMENCLQDPTNVTKKAMLQCLAGMQTASRNFCHKQFTWFRDDAMFAWVDASQGTENTFDEILGLYEQPKHSGGSKDNGRLTKEQERALRQYQTKLIHLADADTQEKAFMLLKEGLDGVHLQQGNVV